MSFRVFASTTSALLMLSIFAHSQFLPNLPQYDNGVNFVAFVQADVNNDGKADIVGLRATQTSPPVYQIAVLLGTGTGGFGAPIISQVSGVQTSLPRTFVVGDFNGDGRLDFALFGLDRVTAQPAVSVMFGNGNGSFGAGHETLLQNATLPTVNCGYTVGDYNGDGKLDIVYAGATLLGKGDGTFSAPLSNPVPGGCLATGDFNNDKKPDIAVDGGLLLGNGNGTFQPATYFTTVSGMIAVADLNGDGNLDMVVAGGKVLLGDGTGHFPTISAFGGGQVVVVHDLNGDGHSDIATFNDIAGFNGGVGAVSVFLNHGDGSFTPGITHMGDGTLANPPYPYTVGLVVADLNGDQKVDLAFNNFAAGISVLPGNGNGTFKGNLASGFSIGVAKLGLFNGDSKVDVLNAYYSDQIGLGNGNGTFTQKNTNCKEFRLFPMAIGDFNGDGKLDFAGAVSVSGVFNVGVCLGNGDGTFTFTGQQFDVGVEHQLLLAGDFNNDGKLDLAASDKNGISILLGNGDGTFQNGIPTAVSASFPTFVVRDFNNDGKLDLAVVTSTGISVLLGKGNGTFEAPKATAGPVASALTFADMNKDGKPDLVLVSNGNVYVMLGKGDGTFQTAVGYAVNGGTATNPVVADFNLDGHLDVAVGVTPSSAGADAEVSLLFGDGTGKLSTPTQFRVGFAFGSNLPAYGGLATADFNGDKKPDLLLGNETFLHQ